MSVKTHRLFGGKYHRSRSKNSERSPPLVHYPLFHLSASLTEALLIVEGNSLDVPMFQVRQDLEHRETYTWAVVRWDRPGHPSLSADTGTAVPTLPSNVNLVCFGSNGFEPAALYLKVITINSTY